MPDQLTFETEIKPLVHPVGRFKSIQQRFEEFHRLNPWVYRRLCVLARQLKAKGMKHMGIAMLWEVTRYHYYEQSVDPNSSFKLNDNYKSRYARLMMAQEEDLKGIFETRTLQSE